MEIASGVGLSLLAFAVGYWRGHAAMVSKVAWMMLHDVLRWGPAATACLKQEMKL